MRKERKWCWRCPQDLGQWKPGDQRCEEELVWREAYEFCFGCLRKWWETQVELTRGCCLNCRRQRSAPRCWLNLWARQNLLLEREWRKKSRDLRWGFGPVVEEEPIKERTSSWPMTPLSCRMPSCLLFGAWPSFLSVHWQCQLAAERSNTELEARETV